MKILHLAVAAAAAASSLLFVGAGTASAATTTVSTASAPAGWSVNNRPGGTGPYVNPVYSAEQARSGAGSLLFATPQDADAVATYHAASVPLSQVTSLSYDWLKVATGQLTFAPAFVLKIDVDGDLGTADVKSAVYEPTLQATASTSCNTVQTLPTGVWTHSDVDAGCLWDNAAQLARPFSEIKADPAYVHAVVVAYGLSQGDGNSNTRAFADLPEFNGNTTNFEVPVVSVAQQGKASQTWFHGGNPSLGGLTVQAWVDIEKTCIVNSCTYRVRGHDMVSKVGSTLRVQSDALRLGSPNRGGVFAADGARNSGESASVESFTTWVNVRAATLCTSPIQLWSGVNASARWADASPPSKVTFRSNPTNTTSKVCLP